MARLFAGTEFDIPPTCDRCGKQEQDCDCPEIVPEKVLLDPAKQTARIAVEKRKKGKIVTVISQLAAADNDLPALCTQLKNLCGAGGTVQDDCVEIQGEHAQRTSEYLSGLGYKINVINTIAKKP